MHVHYEQTAVTRSDCTVQALSWMGKVPDVLPEEDGWKLNRMLYYQEGWLATGNIKGIVGVTFTTCHCKKNFEQPPRTNFNLRGHRSEVILVKWNEPYQKLATCDSNGVIFVWIKHEGRWSIELINDRNVQVTDFSWSHDGRMALICYRDGFVLVGSVAGQRYWSSMLNLENTTISCGVWAPDDQKVMFATTDGQVIVMSGNGGMLSQVTVLEGQEIVEMSWSCEKFNMDETDNNEDGADSKDNEDEQKQSILAMSFKHGAIYLMSNYDDLCPQIINTGLTGIKMEWSNDGEILAVGGFVRQPNLECNNSILFYTKEGGLRFSMPLPTQGKPLTALTWGHNDKRIFLAAGCYVYVFWVTKKVASLEFLCRRVTQRTLKEEGGAQLLPLPTKLKNSVASLFSPTLKGYIPDPFHLREFVILPPPGNERLHCTMLRHGDENSGGSYTLYLEYLGGLIPLLKGKRASKIRPEFVIYDPKIKVSRAATYDDDFGVSSSGLSSSSESDNEIVAEGCGSPRMQRKKRQKRRKRERLERSMVTRPPDEMLYDDNLPEHNKLVEVTSNIWGTKFKIHGLSSYLPLDLGNVVYKTSLLHLQPRQMTVSITELSGDPPAELFRDCRDAHLSPGNMSEDTDDEAIGQGSFPENGLDGANGPPDEVVPISPEPCVNHARIANHNSVDSFSQTPVVEVPVVVERHTIFMSKSEKAVQCDVTTVDSSTNTPTLCTPPARHRRSQSTRSRSLSPAEQAYMTSNTNSLLESSVHMDGDVLREVYANQGAIPKVLVHNARQHENRSPIVAVDGGREPGRTDKGVGGPGDGLLTNGVRPLWPSSQPPQGIKYIDEDNEDVGNCGERKVGNGVTDHSPSDISAKGTQTLHPTSSDGVEQNLALYFGFDYDKDSSDSVKSLATTPQEPQRRIVLQECKPDTCSTSKSSSSSSSSSSKSKVKESVKSHIKEKVTRECRVPSISNILESLRGVTEGPRTSPQITPKFPKLSKHKSQERETMSSDEGMCRGEFPDSGDVECLGSASLPASPVHRPITRQHRRTRSKGDIPVTKNKVQSPLPHRRIKNHKTVDSSDEEVLLSGDEITTSHNYKNLETFQKAQLKQKLKKARCRSTSEGNALISNQKRYLVMHNKAPLWNENSQVYQLDFGGRVTQESAKNFQIEFKGKQVMQFGRIDGNAYTLDFQYPFTAAQAFAVALANVTQRLK